MSATTTIVTALYDIGRGNLPGGCAKRSFDKYLDWFKDLLTINAPMVIFVPDDIKAHIKKYRPREYLTTIVIRKFTDLDAYQYHDRIQQTIDKMVKEPNEGTSVIPSHFKECPEFITAKYQTILFSKFDLLKETAAKNPYQTEYFIWLDAGTFYGKKPPFDTTLPWPDKYKIKILGDKFLISNEGLFDPENKSILEDKRKYLRGHDNKICAFILGGTKGIIDKVHEDLWTEVDNALELGVMNNDQYMLQMMIAQNPQDYYLWGPTRQRYSQLPVPLCDRMILYELSIGKCMGEPYPRNNIVKSLTLSTREIPSSKYEKWEATSKYFGYNYEILCKDRKWEGFGMKIREYHKRLLEITEEYCVLTDSNDGFFTGPPEELVDKFLSLGVDSIVGSEMFMAYPNGRYDSSIIEGHFDNIKESEQIFPNSGFIMGKTKDVISLLERNLSYIDDQAACFDAIYEGFPLAIDYNTTLVGNVPNYHERNHLGIRYFRFDEKQRRYKNIHNDETPVFLHFPGGNWVPMKEFYDNIFLQAPVLTQSSDTSNLPWISFAIFIIVIIFTLITIYYS